MGTSRRERERERERERKKERNRRGEVERKQKENPSGTCLSGVPRRPQMGCHSTTCPRAPTQTAHGQRAMALLGATCLSECRRLRQQQATQCGPVLCFDASRAFNMDANSAPRNRKPTQTYACQHINKWINMTVTCKNCSEARAASPHPPPPQR